MFSRIACALGLLSASVFGAEESPSVSSEPDFYSAPGINANRVYDSQQSIMVDAFTGSMQTHYTDLVVPGTGIDIVVNRSFNSSEQTLIGVAKDYKNYEGNKWSIHFGKLDSKSAWACIQGSLAIPNGVVFITPDGASQTLMKHSAIYMDLNKNEKFDKEVDYRPAVISSSLWKAHCSTDQELVVSSPNGLKYYVGGADVGLNVVKIEDVNGNYLTIKSPSQTSF